MRVLPLAVMVLTLTLANAAAPAPVLAQEQPLQAANGGALYLGSLEGIFVVGAPIGLALALANGSDLAEGLMCMMLFPLCAVLLPGTAAGTVTVVLGVLLSAALVLATPPTIAGVGGAEGWDADGSLVLTSGTHGLLSGGLLGAGIGGLAGGSREAGGVIAGLLGSAGAITYSALRLDALVRDPRLGVEANLLMWGPPVAMIVTAIVARIAGLEPDVGMILAGVMGLLAHGLAFTLAEVALAEPVPVVIGP